MAEVTDRVAPLYVPTTNALAAIPDETVDVPPAYYSLGSTPIPMNNPPNVGDKGTLLVRWECTGERKKIRNDGEMRYVREMSILWAVADGQPRPPDPDTEQPALFDDDGEPLGAVDAGEWDDEPEPEVLGDILEGVDRPDFSDGDHA